MSLAEFYLWARYRRKYGPMNPIRKYNEGFALVASQVNNMAGGKAKPSDFIMYGKEDDIVVSDDEFVTLLKMGGKVGKRR